jgi:hypothetical protein
MEYNANEFCIRKNIETNRSKQIFVELILKQNMSFITDKVTFVNSRINNN